MKNALMTTSRHPLKTQLLLKGQMDVNEVVTINHWLDALVPGKYRPIVYGYAILEDGTGFSTDFLTLANGITSEMINAADQKVSPGLKDINLKDYGMSEELEAQLKELDCTYYAGYEELEDGLSRIVLHFTWPNYHFSRDAFTLAWYGYKAENGKIVRDGKNASEEVVKQLLVDNMPAYVELVE